MSLDWSRVILYIFFRFFVKWPCHFLALCSVGDRWVSEEHGRMLLTVGRRKYSVKGLSSFYFVHQNTHLKWPGIEPSHLQWVADEKRPEPRQGRVMFQFFLINIYVSKNDQECVPSELNKVVRFVTCLIGSCFEIWPVCRVSCPSFFMVFHSPRRKMTG